MCGITGILALNERGKSHLQTISFANSCLASRGPDAEGVFLHENAALAHRRLSIIDTSSNASQPFTDASGRFSLVFNGEIFNFPELRSLLEAKGYAFRSQSDTEVLLYLFMMEGPECLSRLDGEFAFAIFDTEKEELFLARDRFGIKPLYYYIDEDRFVFASEMKAITAFNIPKSIDRASLQLYLHLNYIPSPWTIFENVFKLESGTCMTVNRKGERTSRAYYSIPYSPLPSSSDYPSAVRKLRSALEAAVEKRMIADVPLGCFLSGGIDSSIITSIAAKRHAGLHTFSVGYKDEPYFDETRYAMLVAKKYRTKHTVFSLGNDDLFASLHQMLDYLDEPFADSSALAVHILSMHTRKHVTVALSGDGADELFGGYNKHAAELKARQHGLASRMVRLAYPLLKQLPKSRNSRTGNLTRQLMKFAEGAGLGIKERYWRWAGFTGPGDRLLINTDDKSYQERKASLLSSLNEDFNSVLLTDVRLVLENDMLVKTDRMSMSQSLEVRVPFLSQEVADLAFSFPPEFKIVGKDRKKILKDAFRTDLPPELLHRPKQGFEVPLLKWFRTELKGLICDELLEDAFIREQGIFDPGEVSRLRSMLFGPDPNDAVARVWALIVFQHWWIKTCR